MTTSSVKRIADLLLGTEPKQRLRIYRSLMAASVYLVCVALQGYACLAGFMHWTSAAILSSLIVLNILFWYGVMRSGFNLRFEDPALTLPQILSALTVIAGAYAITGPVHGSTLMLLALVLVFGIFNMKAQGARIASVYTLVIMGVTIAIKSRTEPDHFPIKLEIAHFVLVASIVPTISSLAAQLSNLRAKLQNQKEELSQALSRIQILATRDELTGLYNRRHMMDVLNQHQKRLMRTGYHRFCLAIIDIDFFKRINDTHGHGVGDEVLRNFAQSAAAVLRETDVIARWGGEEFLVLLNDTHTSQATIGLDRIREHLEKTLLVPALPDLRPTFSAGLTGYSTDEPLHTCIERADRALYRAKAEGRNRTVVVDTIEPQAEPAAEAVA
ncbi:MAG TPA: GGDEF domain-containing protein [Aquabacterium sp.]|uniref:GGDEF domain-containing protein n=1 Tax=Aquabacterium sp. TaxID=1872578 RepID=UPI002E2FA319|nr:GGDEF domain-containing protein [Aquabacterium sp.]HEX5371828.1 GGDEF domain-containing protein [Aquabacterium sp.]